MKNLTKLLFFSLTATLYAETDSFVTYNRFAQSYNQQDNTENKNVVELRKKARQRMRLDNDAYSTDQQEEIEKLYQSINRKWQKADGKKALKELLKKYKNANRTGCAILYLGQITEGRTREEYLNQAITEYNDSWYGDGVQVGAYARYLLGVYYQKKRQANKAEKLFDEIKTQYLDSIDHQGTALVELIEKQNRLFKK